MSTVGAPHHLSEDPLTDTSTLSDAVRVAGITVLAIDTPTLGERSYLAHDGHVALVVDPRRDLARVERLVSEHGLDLRVVAETHIRSDYVTGGYALAQKTGADYLVNADDEVAFERTPVHDGQTIEVGNRMRLTIVGTPGHTFTHLSHVLSVASTGEQHTHDLVRLQHASAHELAQALPDSEQVFPTHGFGSFCSATRSEATASTIDDERLSNPVLTQDEETYVRELLAGLGTWPAHYVHMAPVNASGLAEPDLSRPALADAAELRERIEAGEWAHAGR